MLCTPSACASTFGATESFVPKVAKPSMSLTRRPASATAAFIARVASVNTETPDSRENSVQPIPTIAACERGNLDLAWFTAWLSFGNGDGPRTER
jgi:hypothetical protein